MMPEATTSATDSESVQHPVSSSGDALIWIVDRVVDGAGPENQ